MTKRLSAEDLQGPHRAFVTAPFRGAGLEMLQQVADVVLDPWIEHVPLRIWDGAKLAEQVQDYSANILIVESDFVMGPEIMEVGLQIIGSCRGDPNNVDVTAATEHGIPVLFAPGRNADGVAEMTLALLFAVNRHLLEADADLRAGQVFKGDRLPYQRFRAWQLAGQTVGIIGLGAVGRAASWRFAGLGMNVLSFDPFNPAATHTNLEEMLPHCQVVSMHAAPTPDTLAMMGAQQFAAMPEGSVYLNSARAGLHDLQALLEALESQHLSGAGLDHFDGEQLPPGHGLLARTDVVLTPHIGGATYNTEVNHSMMIAADVAAILAGEMPQHCVNPEVL